MGGGNEPVRRREFDLWRGPWEDRVRALETWREGHLAEHEQDEREQAVEVRERRRWSWREIVVAGIAAGGTIVAAVVQALGR